MFNSLQPHGHTSGSPVLHYLPEFAETHFHRVGDPTQLSHPPPPYYPAFNFPSIRSFPTSQLFTPGGQSIGTSASELPVNIQGWIPLGFTVKSQLTRLKHGWSQITGSISCSISVVSSARRLPTVWRRKWQTTSVFLPWEPHEQYSHYISQ